MRYMKRLSVALIAVGLSAPAFANDSIFVPSQHSGFKVSVDTLYLRENSINKIVMILLMTYSLDTYLLIQEMI
jgi:hypothetical protein